MKKSVLVIETPEKCVDCKLRCSMDEREPFCYATLKRVSDDEYYKKKPEWCPLVDIPDMDGLMAAATVAGCLHPVEYAHGWNDLRAKLVK